jgi:hypothetical protein
MMKHGQRHIESEWGMIDRVVVTWAHAHSFEAMKSQIEECDCRSDTSTLTKEVWDRELTAAKIALHDALSSALYEFEMQLMCGEFAAVEPKKPEVDDSWVQFAQGTW